MLTSQRTYSHSPFAIVQNGGDISSSTLSAAHSATGLLGGGTSALTTAVATSPTNVASNGTPTTLAQAIAAYNLANGTNINPQAPWTFPGWDSGGQNSPHAQFENWMARNFPGAAGGNDYGAANKGGSASPGGVTSTACAAGDTTCQLAQAFSQLAGQGAPVQASPTSDAQPTVVPTQTGGTTNPLPAFILLGAAIGAGFWYYEKHKHAAGK